jgi:hypothetical protein
LTFVVVVVVAAAFVSSGIALYLRLFSQMHWYYGLSFWEEYVGRQVAL